MSQEKIELIIEGEFKNSKQVTDSLKQVNKLLEDSGDQAAKSEKHVSSFWSTLKKVAGIGAIYLAAKGMKDLAVSTLKAAGSMEQYQTAFSSMIGSAGKAKKLLEDITLFSKSTPFQFDEIAKSSKMLLAFGVSAEQIIPTLKVLGDVSAGLGIPISQLGRVYGQVKANITLTGEELRQFTEAGVPMIEELAKVLGVAQSSIKQMASDGEIQFSHVQQALVNLTSQGGRFKDLMDAQSKTFLGSVSNMLDTISALAVKIGNVVMPTASKAVNTITNALNSLNQALEDDSSAIHSFGSVFSFVFNIITSIFKSAYSLLVNFFTGVRVLIPSLKTLTAVLLSLTAVLTVLVGKSAVVTLFISLRTAAIALFTVLAANPFALIASAIGLVITALGFAVNNFESFSFRFKKFFLETKIVLLELEASVYDTVQNILKYISSLEKIPGFSWIDDAKKKFSDLRKSALDDIDIIRESINNLGKQEVNIKPIATPSTRTSQVVEALRVEKIQDVADKSSKKEKSEKKKEEKPVSSIKREAELMAKENLLQQKLINDEITQGEYDKEKLKLDIQKNSLKYEEEYLREKKDLQQKFLDEKITQDEYVKEKEKLDSQMRLEALKMDLDSEYLIKESNTVKLMGLSKKRREQEKKDTADRNFVENLLENEHVKNAEKAANELVILQHSKHKELAIVGKAAAIFNITIETARSAVSAMAALSGIPIVGPALGKIAAAAIYAYGAERLNEVKRQSFAVGTDEVPNDMTANIHAGEMIVPKTFAEAVRQGKLSIVGGDQKKENNTASIYISFDGANFIGDMNDTMVYNLGVKLSNMINENLLTPIPFSKA